MNYQKVYNQIIERAKTRKLEGYKEKHHIVPKCMGGLNNKENLVELTPREHFLCHLLLIKIYSNNLKLKQALWLMTIQSKSKGIKISNRSYELCRLEYINIVKNKPKHTKESKQKLRESRLGKKMSQETKNKISLVHKGNKYALGFKNNELQKISKSIANKGKILSNETKLKISQGKKGCKYPKEHGEKISKALKGRKRTKEQIEAHKNKMKGIKWSNNSNLKRSKSMKGKNTRSVIQYDLQDNLIKKYNSLSEACKELNKLNRQGDITACCQGKQKTAFGFKWKYQYL